MTDLENYTASVCGRGPCLLTLILRPSSTSWCCKGVLGCRPTSLWVVSSHCACAQALIAAAASEQAPCLRVPRAYSGAAQTHLGLAFLLRSDRFVFPSSRLGRRAADMVGGTRISEVFPSLFISAPARDLMLVLILLQIVPPASTQTQTCPLPGWHPLYRGEGTSPNNVFRAQLCTGEEAEARSQFVGCNRTYVEKER